MTPEDVRAARALMQWSQADLAQVANLGVSTIAEFEKASRIPKQNGLDAIKRALEGAGVRFTAAGPTIFGEIALYIMTQKSGTEMRFRYTLEGAGAVQEIVAAFGSVDGDAVELDMVQTADARLKARIDALLYRYGSTAPPLNKLKKIVGAMGEGERFLLLPEAPATTADRLGLERYLHRLNHPDHQDDDAGIDDLFGTLLERYDMTNPRTDRRALIGADREPRTCRFCRRTAANGASFEKKAHVIPTALGNDHLKSAEECDDCNGHFGRETEPSLIAMLDVQRVFLGTQGRGKNEGRPKLRFGEASLAHDGKKVNIASRSLTKDASGAMSVDLGKGAPLVPSAVYRALVKMALSVVGEEQLPELKETIEWVRHGTHVGGALPTVASAVVFLPPDPSAQLTVYTRKAPHQRLPHIVGEFRLGCYIYVFAVPFSHADKWNLVGFFGDADFKDTFKHYFAAAQWMQQDLNRDTKVTLAPRLRFAPRDV